MLDRFGYRPLGRQPGDVDHERRGEDDQSQAYDRGFYDEQNGDRESGDDGANCDRLRSAVKPRPARQSRTMPPNSRLLISHSSNRSDDFEKKNAASRTGPTVGMRGTAMPTNAIPRKKNPRMMKMDRSTRLLTTVMER